MIRGSLSDGIREVEIRGPQLELRGGLKDLPPEMRRSHPPNVAPLVSQTIPPEIVDPYGDIGAAGIVQPVGGPVDKTSCVTACKANRLKGFSSTGTSICARKRW